MFWNKSDHKKYGFLLVLYLFMDMCYFKSEKGDNTKLSCPGFLYKQRRQMHVPLNCKRFILKQNF